MDTEKAKRVSLYSNGIMDILAGVDLTHNFTVCITCDSAFHLDILVKEVKDENWYFEIQAETHSSIIYTTAYPQFSNTLYSMLLLNFHNGTDFQLTITEGE